MVNAQQYLDTNYPKYQRTNITELDISAKNLEGSLKLEGFTNLQFFDCWWNKITSLEIVNCPKLVAIGCYGLLNINNENKLASLKLGKLDELVELQCYSNQLTELDIRGCPSLETLLSSDNLLTNLDLANNSKLQELDIRNNNFAEKDLKFLENLVNLKGLHVGSDDQEKINQGIYNRFSGNLKPLQNVTKLERFGINNTDLDSGLECLSDNIRVFTCSSDKRSNAKVRIIEQELRKFGEPEKFGNVDNFANLLKLWKMAHVPAKQLESRNNQLEKKLLEKEKDTQIAQGKLTGWILRENWETEEGLKSWIKQVKKDKKEIEKELEQVKNEINKQAQIQVLSKK